jgi:hypothetical protein
MQERQTLNRYRSGFESFGGKLELNRIPYSSFEKLLADPGAAS